MREEGDFGLQSPPIERGGRDSGFKDYGRTTLPRVDQMQTKMQMPATDVYQAPRRRKLALIAS